MGLHRDIYWVGRQWAVTGFGMQAIDQRLKGTFDIEASLLWDDNVSRRMRAQAWVNAEDFDDALAIARKRFPEPPPKSPPSAESVPDLIPPVSAPASQSVPNEAGPDAESWRAQAKADSPPSTAPLFQLRMEGAPARFLPQWRIRQQRGA